VEGARLLQEESLKQNPASAGVHAVMAKILQVDGDYERALDEIVIAKRLSPDDMAMTTFLYFEAAILQDLGRFDDAIAAARMSLLLAPRNFDAMYVKITSLYAGGYRKDAEEAVAQLRDATATGSMPISGWDQPFVESVADQVTLSSGASLYGLRYNEGLHLVLAELGWDAE